VQFAANPDGRYRTDQVVKCRFAPSHANGKTPKFDCALPGSETIKVKYGANNPEVFAEVIASRLLSALGFPTDTMYVVAAVECAGCPERPFEALQCLEHEGATEQSCFGHVDYTRSRTFPDAVVERSLPGRRIEAGKRRGWGWNELAKIDPGAGGADRAQVDALRLMAVFLAHWDNKSENQRLVCLEDSTDAKDTGGSCEQPLAMVQDLGATFGPNKIDLTGWLAYPVWSDVASCTVSMRALPYSGLSFPDIQITEAGRRFLADRLRQLTRSQVRDLFRGARLERYRPKAGDAQPVDAWVDGFMNKVADVSERPPCPA
jgi:hypothetical protein